MVITTALSGRKAAVAVSALLSTWRQETNPSRSKPRYEMDTDLDTTRNSSIAGPEARPIDTQSPGLLDRGPRSDLRTELRTRCVRRVAASYRRHRHRPCRSWHRRRSSLG